MIEADLGDKAGIIADVCSALASDGPDHARAILGERYPFVPFTNAGRHYTKKQMLAVFRRDGFVDRYSGARLVCPPALRLLSKRLSSHFPFHPNWRTDACHFAFWELSPTVDHVLPVSRGGADDLSNWVTTSMVRNSAKGNFTLAEMAWTLHPVRQGWDGLLGWFVEQVKADRLLLEEPFLRQWYSAAGER